MHVSAMLVVPTQCKKRRPPKRNQKEWRKNIQINLLWSNITQSHARFQRHLHFLSGKLTQPATGTLGMAGMYGRLQIAEKHGLPNFPFTWYGKCMKRHTKAFETGWVPNQLAWIYKCKFVKYMKVFKRGLVVSCQILQDHVQAMLAT